MSPTAVIIGALTLYSMGYFRSKHHFLLLDNIEKKIKSFENIMENGAFALLEQMLHFP